MMTIEKLFGLCRTAAEQLLDAAVDADEKEMKELIRPLKEVLMRLDRGPVRAIVFGQTSSGKSTLINALTGQIVVPEAENVSTAVPTYIFGGAANVGEGNVVYQKCNFAADGQYSAENMSRYTFLLNGNYDSTHTDAALEAFLKTEHPHYRVKAGSRSLKEAGISLIDTPGTNAGSADTESLFSELESGFEILVFMMKTVNMLDPDQKMAARLLELLLEGDGKYRYFDRNCLFAVSNDFGVSVEALESTGLEGIALDRGLLETEKDLVRYFKNYSAGKKRLYCFSSLCARLQTTGSIYHYTNLLPPGYTDTQFGDCSKRQQEEGEILALVKEEPPEEDFVRLKDDLRRQAKALAEDPAFILDTVEPLWKELRHGMDMLRKYEKAAVDAKYSCDPVRELPNFGLEELGKLSGEYWFFRRLEMQLSDVENLLKQRQDILKIQSIGARLSKFWRPPEDISAVREACEEVRELFRLWEVWRRSEEVLRKEDFGDKELKRMTRAVRRAEELEEEYEFLGTELKEGDADFGSEKNSFVSAHSLENHFNGADVWFCKENHSKMDKWVLGYVDQSDLKPIYDQIRKDYQTIFDRLRADLDVLVRILFGSEQAEPGNPLRNTLEELWQEQYKLYREYYDDYGSFLREYGKGAFPKPSLLQKISGVNDSGSVSNQLSKWNLNLFVSNLDEFIRSKKTVLQGDRSGLLNRVRTWRERADFGRVCAAKITTFFDSEIAGYAETQFQKMHDDFLSAYQEAAGTYFSGVSDTKETVSLIRHAFESTHAQKTECLRKKLQEETERNREAAGKAYGKLMKNIWQWKDEALKGYETVLNRMKEGEYAHRLERYAAIEASLNEAADGLALLRKVPGTKS